MLDFTALFNYLETFPPVISGIILASAKQFDWLEAYTAGVVTVVGGAAAVSVFLMRIIAVKYHISIPVLKREE